MPLSAGEKLGPYEILGPIGKGGMGEVYRAKDPRLKRDVAIKISSERFNERFEREARAIAALNHSNICHLYDVGPNYLVMELVEGPTLAERIKQGPVPMEETLAVARQIAAALEAAHEKGITHRDLKPGNIKVKVDGTVKVLDFGLAKMGGTPAVASEESPTLTLGQTEAGMILGTAAYMSPEQAKGKPVDQRADIYAFGLVLYEMLTGKRLHHGETTTEVLASVIKDEPHWEKVPARAQTLLRRCLEKDPQKRLRHIGDAMPLVEETAAMAATPARARPKWLWPAIVAGLLALLGLTAWSLWPKPPAPTRATRFQVALPDGVQFNSYVSLSPDGHKLVFAAGGAQSGLWVHDLDTLEWRKLPGTENALSLFWSPDSRFLGFGVGNQLKKIEIAGGPPQTICDSDVTAGSGAWNRDNVIVFGPGGGRNGPMRRVAAAGGVPTDITVVDGARDRFHALPAFLPDGKHFLYFRQGTAEAAGMYVGSLDVKPAEQSRERILPVALAARYAEGNLFFMRDNTLMVQPFNDRKLKLTGEPLPLAEGVATAGSIGVFSVSESGVLAYRGGQAAATRNLVWYDRQGKMASAFPEAGSYVGLALSPDAAHAAVRVVAPGGRGDIWVLDLARGVPTKLTFRQSIGSSPIWSPDRNRIIFAAGAVPYVDTIYEQAPNEAGEGRELLKRPGESITPTSTSTDGKFLLYNAELGSNQGVDLYVLPLDSAAPRQPVALLRTPFNEGEATFSPDGRWIAYISNESGRNEVYVRPFNPEGLSLGEVKSKVSKDGTGRRPQWRADGKEIFFGDPTGSPMAVEVSANGTVFQPIGVPSRLFNVVPNATWNATPDGKRFLVSSAPLPNTQMPITVVMNWQADLKR
jgi:serine/threonine protein kinase/Tol biopolymer transport system component